MEIILENGWFWCFLRRVSKKKGHDCLLDKTFYTTIAMTERAMGMNNQSNFGRMAAVQAA